MNKDKYLSIRTETREKGVTLVAVSKTKPIEDIQAVYALGQRVFGENRAQELRDKAQALPKDIEWHMIGHLQRNKVKYIAPHVSLIHSIDKLSILEEVNKRAAQHNRVINVLLQVHIAQEESKHGFTKQEIIEFVQQERFTAFQAVNIVGVMGMATFTDDQVQVRKEFAALKIIFDELKASVFEDKADFEIISMGMSGDYQIAIEEGSTMVRVGSLIFGSRM